MVGEKLMNSAGQCLLGAFLRCFKDVPHTKGLLWTQHSRTVGKAAVEHKEMAARRGRALGGEDCEKKIGKVSGTTKTIQDHPRPFWAVSIQIY